MELQDYHTQSHREILSEFVDLRIKIRKLVKKEKKWKRFGGFWRDFPDTGGKRQIEMRKPRKIAEHKFQRFSAGFWTFSCLRDILSTSFEKGGGLWTASRISAGAVWPAILCAWRFL